MFKSIFGKTLYGKRWMALCWFVGLAALVIFTLVFYPTLSQSIGQSLKDVPDSLKSFVGSSLTYSTIAGYTDLQVFVQFEYIILIFGILLFTGLLAGEESDGTLQVLLAQPVTRARVYRQKLSGGMALLALICLSVLVGVLIGLVPIHEHLSLGRLLISTLDIWLAALLFCSLSYALGAATGKRGLSGGLAGALAFVSLLVTTLADSVKSLHMVNNFSPFHYFDKPGILLYGPNWSHMMVLGAASIVLLVLGYWFFRRRDIPQR